LILRALVTIAFGLLLLGFRVIAKAWLVTLSSDALRIAQR
jgi:hypothetical protein